MEWVCELQSWCHPHSKHRFPAPSSKLPDLVTPLKGYSSSPRSCPATRSAPSERLLAPKHALKHETHPPRVKKKKKKEKKKRRLQSRFKRLWFHLCWCHCKLYWRLWMTRLVLFELFITNLPLFEHQQKNKQKNCSLADSFLDPMA